MNDEGRSRSRPWWRVLGTIAALCIAAIAVLQLVSLIGRSTETVDRTVSAEGVTRLEVGTHDGRVEVVGTDRDDISMVVRVTHGLWRTRLSIVERGGVLHASARCPLLSNHCNADFRIEVPEDLDVVVDSGNGDVIARDLAGRSVLESSNGTVRASGLTGVTRLSSDNGNVAATALSVEGVEATSDNGDVSVELSSAPLRVTAESSNGDVDVRLPDGPETYVLDMSTDNGERRGSIRTDPDSDRLIRITSDNGDVTVGYGPL